MRLVLVYRILILNYWENIKYPKYEKQNGVENTALEVSAWFGLQEEKELQTCFLTFLPERTLVLKTANEVFKIYSKFQFSKQHKK